MLNTAVSFKGNVRSETMYNRSPLRIQLAMPSTPARGLQQPARTSFYSPPPCAPLARAHLSHVLPVSVGERSASVRVSARVYAVRVTVRS